MTPQAEQLEQALSALVSAVDAYQEHGRKSPGDRIRQCELGVAVDEAAKKVPKPIFLAVMRHLAEFNTDSSSAD